MVWPRFRGARKVAKFATAILTAFVAGYASGGWAAGLIAALAALGAHDAGKNARRLLEGA